MNTWLNLNFQESNSPTMEQLIFFHDHSMMILIIIIITITYSMLSTFSNNLIARFMLNQQNLETLWTIVPAIMLMFMAIPSIKLLYMIEEMKNPSLSIKIMANQWYWNYDYPEFKNIKFNSYMITDLNNKYNFRLLDVDNRITLPTNLSIRVLTSSMDVIHSWTMPSLGIKIDSIPGRLNQLMINIKRPGVMFGQCSEICGMNHSFMPIVLESVKINYFYNWIKAIN